jgi:hypothetical protein
VRLVRWYVAQPELQLEHPSIIGDSMKIALLIVLLTAPLMAQSVIPAGTILPVRLNSSLNSRKIKVGQLITARLMQDVPLEPRAKIQPR